ncbi:hypothetical protein MMC21_003750 [Puttea exsequens]|nr:hypothetical protein [Puttea exsequens]
MAVFATMAKFRSISPSAIARPHWPQCQLLAGAPVTNRAAAVPIMTHQMTHFLQPIARERIDKAGEIPFESFSLITDVYGICDNKQQQQQQHTIKQTQPHILLSLPQYQAHHPPTDQSIPTSSIRSQSQSPHTPSLRPHSRNQPPNTIMEYPQSPSPAPLTHQSSTSTTSSSATTTSIPVTSVSAYSRLIQQHTRMQMRRSGVGSLAGVMPTLASEASEESVDSLKSVGSVE